MDLLDDLILFNVTEVAREERVRENNTDNYNTFDSSWDKYSSDDNDEE